MLQGKRDLCHYQHLFLKLHVLKIMYSIVLGGLAIVLYAIASGLLLRQLLRRTDTISKWGRTGPLIVAALAVLVHTQLLGGTILVPEGINLSFFNALSLMSWVVCVLLIIISYFRSVEGLGVVVLPFTAFAVGMSVFFPGDRTITGMERWPLELHITFSLLAYALLALATIQALLLTVQDYRLRTHNPGGFVRNLPPLMVMESLLFQLIGAGFVLLSFGMLTGFIFLEDVFAQQVFHKSTLSVIAWLVFGNLLWGRWRFGWRGRVALRWTLAGFTTLVLAYFGSKFVLEMLLQNGV